MKKIILEMTASAAGVNRKVNIEFPCENAEYDLSDYEYPGYRFGRISICGNIVRLGDVVRSLEEVPITITHHYKIYGYDKVPWDEEVNLFIDIRDD